jgi:polysaccharide biosynthesis protein PslH
VPIDFARPLQVLWIATKAPRPAIDGGRLVMALTLEALVASGGVEITLVAPTVAEADASAPDGVRSELIAARPHAWWKAALGSARSGRPVSIERHRHAAVARRVTDLVRRERFDLVHAEQLQALAGAEPARRAGLPCVLRAQNVESALWQSSPQGGGTLATRLFRAEAQRLRRFEAAALAAADVTIALSAPDALKLAALEPAARVIVVPPPAPACGNPGTAALAGDPACVWIGSGGWAPNAEAMTWLLDEIWPAMLARVPNARLHIFGLHQRGMGRPGVATPNVEVHGAARDSAEAFAPGSTLLLPLRTAAGVRMRLLEAWSRGIPVIASPAAVEGLDASDNGNVLIARTAADFADALVRLVKIPYLRVHLTTVGRETLARRHDPAAIATATIDAYREAIARHRSPR